ncbi:unnamed protein product [Penicillium discolor]
MLQRAKRLQSDFDGFCSQCDQDHFVLNQEEWGQIEYLLCITQPFLKFTTLLSKTKDNVYSTLHGMSVTTVEVY